MFNVVLVQIAFLTKSSSTFNASKAIHWSPLRSGRGIARPFVIADTLLVMIDQVLNVAEGPGANGAMVQVVVTVLTFVFL